MRRHLFLHAHCPMGGMGGSHHMMRKVASRDELVARWKNKVAFCQIRGRGGWAESCLRRFAER